MARKELSFLRGGTRDGAVELTAFKTTPGFQDEGRRGRYRPIRVYRLAADRFVFGQDYAEFFDGLDWRDAELLFSGPLPEGNRRKFTFRDESARTGHTYAYWMGGASGLPTGPVAIRVRDPEVWWTAEELDRRLAALRSAHPDAVRVFRAGTDGPGQAHPRLRGRRRETSASPSSGRCTREKPGRSSWCSAVDRILAEEPSLVERVRVACIPVVNLDERERLARGCPWYLRVNARGVDVNRNFPTDWTTVEHGYGFESDDPDSMTYRGPRPASEPETRAVMSLLRAQRPDAVYAFHCLASICGGFFFAAGAAKGDRAYEARCRAAALPYGKALAPEVPPRELIGYGCTSGSLAAWCYRELGIPAFDVEMSPYEKDALAACRADRTDRPAPRGVP